MNPRRTHLTNSRKPELMKTPLTRTLLILLAVAFAAPLALAHDVDVAGTWDAVAQTPEGDMPAVITISKADDGLEATMEIGGMDRDVSDVVLKGHTLEMTVTYDGVPYDVELEVDGDKMVGTYTGSMASGALTATRRAE
jgi:hypothetical protein